MYYFDYAATCPLNKEIFEYCWDKMEDGIFGNASSSHTEGIKASKLLENARIKIANEFRCEPNEIYFTSGGSESDNMALKGVMLKYKPEEAELITSTIEHPAILETCKQLERFGYKIRYVKPNDMGYIQTQEIKKLINEKTKLISIMTVNNELGVIENIYEIAHLAHNCGVLFHTDAVQSVGKIQLNLSTIDMASFSGHKFGAVKGIGFLYKKDYIELEPLICGGGQEKGLRAGTENVFGAVMMSECIDKYTREWLRTDYILDMQNEFVKQLKNHFKDNIIINSNQLGIVNVAFKNINGETLQLMLSSKGYAVSTASACHSNSNEPSYVLKEIGVPKDFIKGSLRISFSPDTKPFEINNLVKDIIFYADHLLKIGKE